MKNEDDISRWIKASQLQTSDQFTDQLMIMIEKESQAFRLPFWTIFFHNIILIACFSGLAYCAITLNEHILLLNNKLFILVFPAAALLIFLIVFYRNGQTISKPLLQ